MKIVFSGEDFYPPISGGDISVLSLFNELKKEHEVEVICTGKRTEVEEVNGIKVHKIQIFFSNFPSWSRRYFLNKFWLNVLEKHLKRKKYDLIITQSVLLPSSITIAKKYRIKSFAFIRSYEHFCLSHLRDVNKPERHNCLRCASWKYKIQYLFFKELIKWHENALKKADFHASNSKFMQSIVKKWYGIDSEVIYPFINLNEYISDERTPKYITMIRPDIRKGVEIFIKIADLLPKKKFLAVGKTDRKGELIKRGNITYIPWVKDMKEIYSLTKILLVPSVWFEPFGRVVVEGMCNGIPCIVSNKGGLIETVNSNGIVIEDIFNINSWVNHIKKLENLKLYKKLSEKSKKQAKKFNFNIQYEKFKKIINRI